MHIILVAEGFKEGLQKFEDNFNGRVYANGKSKVRVREIKLLHFGFNECGYEEVLSDIKSMTRYNEDKNTNTQKDTTTELHSKFQKYIKYFRRFFKGIKPIEDDLDRVPIGKFQEEMKKKGIVFNTSLTPIGRINDYRNLETGEELV